MKKKVFKGWVSRVDKNIDDIIEWHTTYTMDDLYLELLSSIMKQKGNKRQWSGTSYPPRRITVTVELED